MFFEALIPITMFISVAAAFIIITYITRTAKHKERMALIENGADPSLFERPKKAKKYSRRSGSGALKFGMLAVGLGLGLILGALLDVILRMEPLPHFAMMLICGGGALVIYYSIINKREREIIQQEAIETEELV